MNNTRHSSTSRNQNAGNKPINVCQININGLSKHSQTALDKFSFDQQLSIVALQETNLNSNKTKDLSGFTNLETFILSTENCTYGVGLLISPILYPQRMKALEEDGLDIIWCLVKINQIDVLIASVYCPPHNSTDLQKITANITATKLWGKTNKIKNLMILGDFNSRSINWGDTTTNPRGRILMKFIDNTEFMLCTPADKTFVSPNNGGSVIDLLIACGKITDHIQSNWIDRNAELFTGAPIRGHYPVLYALDIGHHQIPNKVYEDYKNTDWVLWKNAIETELLQHPVLNEERNGKDIQEKLVDTLNKAIEKANKKIPKKIISKHSKPFWTNELTTCSKELNLVSAVARRRGTPHNAQLLRDKKAEFKALLIKEKNDWIKDKLSNINVSDSNIFWKRYKILFGESHINYIGNLSSKGILYTKDHDKDQILFEEFFSGKHLQGNNFDETFKEEIIHNYQSIISHDLQPNENLEVDIDNMLQQERIKKVNHCPRNPVEDILNAEVTSDEIDDAIASQKCIGKSTDGYSINPIMLKHLGVSARSVIKKIFNLCLETGNWCWNKADVCFLKKADKDTYLDPGAYRPICITSYIGKILERILERRLRVHCQQYNILDTPQEGFCPKRSTVRYLFKLMTNLGEAKRKKLVSMILLIDFQKAFDSVWIPGLITKLYQYGIKGNMLKLINHLLTSRWVRLKINGKFGKFQKCSLIGLPQGSVLSPLLFVIYISELLSDVHETTGQATRTEAKAYKFADDGTVSVIGDNIESCRKTMQTLCNSVLEWCKKWRMVINCNRNKTEIIIINSSKQAIPNSLPKIKIGPKELQYVEKSKVLGVVIDKDMSFTPHAGRILQQCWYQWYKISKNTTRMEGLNAASLTLLFKTLVTSRLMYASPIWLNNQIESFKDLWSRVILKISGSEYHTERTITEIMLAIPPLDIQLSMNSTKFLLKCMTSEDDMIATILQLEESTKNPLFAHIRNLRNYLVWKEGEVNPVARRKSSRGMQLVNYMHHSHCYYSKDDITQYMHYVWHHNAEQKFPERNIKKWDDLNFKHLFPRNSTRSENTYLAEFIHGHSIRFANFRKSIGMDESDICENCDTMVDSPEHQLFECETFHCPERDELLQLMDNNIADFNWKMITTEEGNTQHTTELFRKIVKFIVDTTEELDEIAQLDLAYY
jgi:exonuclease III